MGETVEVTTSGSAFKVFKGDYISNRGAYRRFLPRPAPQDFTGTRIVFSNPEYIPVGDDFIIVSPTAPVLFKDGMSCIPQPKPLGAAVYCIGNGSAAVNIYVAKKTLRRMREFIISHGPCHLEAPRAHPSDKPVYDINLPCHTPERRSSVKLGAIGFAFTLPVMISAVLIAGALHILAPRADEYRDNVEAIRLVCGAFSVFAPTPGLSAFIAILHAYCCNFKENFFQSTLEAVVGILTAPFGYVVRLLGLTISPLLHPITSYTNLRLLWSLRHKLSARLLDGELIQFSKDVFQILVNGKNPYPTGVVRFVKWFVGFVIQHSKTWWFWYLSWAVVIALAVYMLRAIIMWYTFRITAESSNYFNAFGRVHFAFDESITILPLNFVNGWCSDRYAFYRDGPDYQRLKYQMIDTLSQALILGPTKHGLRMRYFGEPLDRVFPVIYLDGGVVGHLMMACRTKDREHPDVLAFCEKWEEAFLRRYPEQHLPTATDCEMILSNGDIFVEEYNTPTGETYRMTQYHPSRIHIPAQAVVKYTMCSRVTEAAVRTVSVDTGMSVADSSRAFKIVRSVALSSQLFVSREAAVLQASLSEYFLAQLYASFPVVLLSHINTVFWTLVLTSIVFLPVWLPYLVTFVTTTVRDKLNSFYATVTGATTVVALSVRRRVSLLVQGLYDRKQQTQESPHPLSFLDLSFVSSEKPDYLPLLKQVISQQTGSNILLEVELPHELHKEMPLWQALPNPPVGSASFLALKTASRSFVLLSKNFSPLTSQNEQWILSALRKERAAASSNVRVYRLTDRPAWSNRLAQYIQFRERLTASSQGSSTDSNTKSTTSSQSPNPSTPQSALNSFGSKPVTTDTPVQPTSQGSIAVSPQNSDNSSLMLSLITSLVSLICPVSPQPASTTSSSPIGDQSIPVKDVLPFLQSCLSVVFRNVSENADTISHILTPEMTMSCFAMMRTLLTWSSASSELSVSIAELRVLLQTLLALLSAPSTTSLPTSTSPTQLESSEKPSSSLPTSSATSSPGECSPSMTSADTPQSSDPSSSGHSDEPGIGSRIELSWSQSDQTTRFPPTKSSIWTSASSLWRSCVDQLRSLLLLDIGGSIRMGKVSSINLNGRHTSSDTPLSTSSMNQTPTTGLKTDRLTMSNMQTSSSNSPKPRRKKNARKSQRRSGARYTARVYQHKSVRAASALESTSSYARSVLDPAHLRDYVPHGIPDIQNAYTLCNKALVTRSLMDIVPTVTWLGKLSTDTAYSALTPTDNLRVSRVVIIQDPNPQMSAFVLFHGTDTQRNVIGYVGIPCDGTPKNTSVRSRLIARGMTVEQIGPYAERGGYIATHRLDNNDSYYSASDKSAFELSIQELDQNVISNEDGIRGVYSICRPGLRQNYTQWKAYDATTEYRIQDQNGALVNTVNFDGTSYKDPAMSVNAVSLFPPTPFAPADISSSFNFRLTFFSAVQYESNAKVGTRVPAEPGVIDMVCALSFHAPTFYPASFNDLRKIISNVKRVYRKNRKWVDAAMGIISPERQAAVMSLLDSLARE